MRGALVKGLRASGTKAVAAMIPAENTLIGRQCGKTRSSLLNSVSVPKANLFETFTVFGEVLFPTLAKGVIIRRPQMLAVAERFDLDRRPIRRMQRLRNKYQAGPLLLRIPGRAIAVILHPQDVHRILSESPEPFATASAEKRAALAHFEPKNVLLSNGPERADRRHYNEEVLEAHRPIHHLAENFLEVVNSEVNYLHKTLSHRTELTWSDFSDTWFRIVRRIVFGDAAREDHELSQMMAKLRSAANWAFLRPQRKALREQLLHGKPAYCRRIPAF